MNKVYTWVGMGVVLFFFGFFVSTPAYAACFIDPETGVERCSETTDNSGFPQDLNTPGVTTSGAGSATTNTGATTGNNTGTGATTGTQSGGTDTTGNNTGGGNSTGNNTGSGGTNNSGTGGTTGNNTGSGGTTGNNTGSGGTTGNNQGSGFTISFKNPLRVNSVMCLVYLVFRIIVNILAIVAGIYILFAGYKFIAAQGNPGKLEQAKKNFYSVLIGTTLILGAYAIVAVFVNTINQFTTTPIINLPTKTSCENSINNSSTNTTNNGSSFFR